MAQTVAEPRSEVRLKTNGFTYRGIEVSPLDRELYTNDLGEQAFVLSQKSGELRNKTGLYFLGRDAENVLNQEEIQKLLLRGELSPEDVEMTKAFYKDCQARRKGTLPPRGHIHRDLVILEPSATIPGTRKPGEDYIVGIFFEHTNGYDENGKVIETNKTVESRDWVPASGIVVPTRYGTHNRLGIPNETLPDTKENREIAKQRLAEAGLPESELMNFYRWNDGSVVVWSGSDPVGGALYVFLFNWPGSGLDGFGSFPASGSPSGARPASEVLNPAGERGEVLGTESRVLSPEGQVRTYTEAEYRQIVGELADLKAKLMELSG